MTYINNAARDVKQVVLLPTSTKLYTFLSKMKSTYKLNCIELLNIIQKWILIIKLGIPHVTWYHSKSENT
jgi:hypothetical protein